MKEMKIEYKKIEDIIPYENNPRKNEEAVDYVANSIKEFGFKVPIIIDSENVIVTGHTRLKAAEKLGLKQVPVIKADDLTEDQIKAFRIADNKVGEFSSWDLDKLNLELEDINLDMSEFGFTEDVEIGNFELINDEGLENANSSYDHTLKIDRIEIPITEEEYLKIKKKFDDYVEVNGVSFGFVNNLISDDND